jgi:hypothetical protein
VRQRRFKRRIPKTAWPKDVLRTIVSGLGLFLSITV